VFNLRKLNDIEVKEMYHAEVSDRFGSLEDLDLRRRIMVLS
jgi:hypothetical protein